MGGGGGAAWVDGDDEAVDGSGEPFVLIGNGFEWLLVVYLLVGFAGEESGDLGLLQGSGDHFLSFGLRLREP